MSIKLEHVDFYYSAKTPIQYQALHDVCFEVASKEDFIALVGKTGSGKSTLVSLLNGLILPSYGKLTVTKEDENKTVLFEINRPIQLDKKGRNRFYKNKKIKNVKNLRQTVGLVFQFPEYQLFESDVLTDVMYGPKNFGVSKEEAEKQAIEALTMVGIDKSYYHRSPFELSGGEKRKVAIAGIIAMKPDYLVLDEPTAGLDPVSENNMLELFNKIHEQGTAIILISHNMDIVLQYAKKVCVIDDGRIVATDTPLNIFQNEEFLKNSSIDAPYVLKVANELRKNGLNIDIKKVSDIPSLAREIKEAKNG